MSRGIEMDELLPTWLLQNDSVRHSSLRSRLHKGTLFRTDPIKAAYRATMRDAS